MSAIPQVRLKTVFITGAEGALGGAVIQAFHRAGARVIATFHQSPGPASEGVSWVKMDGADPKSVRQAIEQGQASSGPVDALVHCAGGFRYASIDSVTDDEIEFLLSSNLKSAIHLLRELVPAMRKRGFGRIVLVSSQSTLKAPAGMGVYAASKAGLNMLVSSVAEEVRESDININAVLPSMIDTPANRAAMPQADYTKWVSRESLAEIILSLTQEWGRPVNGALIPVTGRL